jgi:anthrone oxygenase-like protein
MSSQLNATLMLIAAGLFTGVLWTLAIERVWIWRTMDARQFAVDFGRSVRRVDLVQPAGAVLSVALAVGYATTVGGTAQVLAIIAALLLVIIIVMSAAIGVPMQKLFRGAAEGEVLSSEVDVPAVRARWINLHLARTVLGIIAFVLLVVAALYP